jgi:hypothetical protein
MRSAWMIAFFPEADPGEVRLTPVSPLWPQPTMIGVMSSAWRAERVDDLPERRSDHRALRVDVEGRQTIGR